MVRSGGILLMVALTSTTARCPGVGRYSSIAIGVDGRALISYDDATNNDVKLAVCRDSGCSAATLSVLDSEGVGAAHTSIAVGPDGLALVSYHAGALKVAHCEDAACRSKVVTTLDTSSGGVGQFTSLAFGVDGLGLISYRDYWNGQLRVAHCENRACTKATITVVEPDACCVGRNSALAIGTDGLALIAYQDDKRGFSTAHCEDVACRTATKRPVVPSNVFVERQPSVRIGRDGLAVISFDHGREGGVVVAHCQDVACTGFDMETLLERSTSAQDTALAIGADGLPLVAYTETFGSLKVAHCVDLRCTTSSVSSLTSHGTTFFPSLAIAPDGLGIISFWDGTEFALKVARCVDAACGQATVSTLDAGGAPL